MGQYGIIGDTTDFHRRDRLPAGRDSLVCKRKYRHMNERLNTGGIVIYQTDDGQASLEVSLVEWDFLIASWKQTYF